MLFIMGNSVIKVKSPNRVQSTGREPYLRSVHLTIRIAMFLKPVVSFTGWLDSALEIE